MTQQDREPTTAAGRRLLSDFDKGKLYADARPKLRRAALAIEAESRAAERAAIRDMIEKLTSEKAAVLTEARPEYSGPILLMSSEVLAILDKLGSAMAVSREEDASSRGPLLGQPAEYTGDAPRAAVESQDRTAPPSTDAPEPRP